MNTQRGSIAFNILMVIMVIIIAVLIYLLAGGRKNHIGNTFGIQSPSTQNTINDAPAFMPNGEFSDGLGTPQTVTKGTLDETGGGITLTEVFEHDINNDGRPDRITRTRVENGTGHFYYEYKIELNSKNKMQNITPAGFRTTEGTDCALQKLQFRFKPDFHVTKISRKWRDTWQTPTMATKTTYTMVGDTLDVADIQQMKSVCDVSELF